MLSLITIILIAAVVAVIVFLKAKNSEDPEEKFTPVISIAEGACSLFVQRGMERFLLREYENYPGRSLFSSCANKKKTCKKLQEALNDILEFLELPKTVNLTVNYYDSADSFQTRAGTYQRASSYSREIVLNLKRAYPLINALAVLCHECTHYFMEYHKLNWNDTSLNEQRTDVVANLIGFNSVLLRGYKEFEIITGGNGFTYTTQKNKIGYITARDCEDLKRFLQKIRKEISARREEERLASELKQEAEKNLNAAKTLIQQLDLIDLKVLKTTNPEELEKIQKVLMEKEARNIPDEIARCESRLKKISSLEQARQLNQDIYNLCSDLAAWLSAFRGKI